MLLKVKCTSLCYKFFCTRVQNCTQVNLLNHCSPLIFVDREIMLMFWNSSELWLESDWESLSKRLGWWKEALPTLKTSQRFYSFWHAIFHSTNHFLTSFSFYVVLFSFERCQSDLFSEQTSWLNKNDFKSTSAGGDDLWPDRTEFKLLRRRKSWANRY